MVKKKGSANFSISELKHNWKKIKTALDSFKDVNTRAYLKAIDDPRFKDDEGLIDEERKYSGENIAAIIDGMVDYVMTQGDGKDLYLRHHKALYGIADEVLKEDLENIYDKKRFTAEAKDALVKHLTGFAPQELREKFSGGATLSDFKQTLVNRLDTIKKRYGSGLIANIDESHYKTIADIIVKDRNNLIEEIDLDMMTLSDAHQMLQYYAEEVSDDAWKKYALDAKARGLIKKHKYESK